MPSNRLAVALVKNRVRVDDDVDPKAFELAFPRGVSGSCLPSSLRLGARGLFHRGLFLKFGFFF